MVRLVFVMVLLVLLKLSQSCECEDGDGERTWVSQPFLQCFCGPLERQVLKVVTAPDYILMLFASIFLLVYFKSLKIGFSISLCSYCVSVKLGLVCHSVGYMHKQVGGGVI